MRPPYDWRGGCLEVPRSTMPWSAFRVIVTHPEERDEIKFGGITGRTKMITNYRHNNLLGT